MTVWYSQVNGQQLGPLSASDLIQAIRDGVVKVDTPIRKDDSQWVPALEVSGLFAAAAKPIIHKLCPYCGCSETGPAPCECPDCGRNLPRLIQRSEPSPVLADGERNPDSPQNQTGVRLKRWVKRLFD